MVDVVLVHPEIPPNAGNVIRLCANTGTPLHLVKPLGFSMDDRQLKRAGLDYREMANVTVHPDWGACLAALGPRRLLAFTTRGGKRMDNLSFQQDDVLVFGPETSGLSADVLASFSADCRVRIPMVEGNRSLNLSNAVAVAVFESWRQLGYSAGT
ncbi:MAG: tRNA (cytidine(34)-2'-O)-methyltransferase [Betaproteobacteria bacterium]|nr:tRNA (cytidine(34)-2'-O)-methyltransferase [Betaproteobacteria bacterium]